jgi:hypothetical protein
MTRWLTSDDVPTIVAEIRTDYIDCEGSVDWPGRRSLGTHARVRGYSLMQAIISSPCRDDRGRVDNAKTLQRLAAVVEAVRVLVDESIAKASA